MGRTRTPGDTAWHANLPEITKKGNGGTICCIDGVCYAPGAPFHGTPGGYVNHSCRCRPCKDAWAKDQRTSGRPDRWRAKNLANGLTTDGHPRKRARHETEQAMGDVAEQATEG